MIAFEAVFTLYFNYGGSLIVGIVFMLVAVVNFCLILKKEKKNE